MDASEGTQMEKAVAKPALWLGKTKVRLNTAAVRDGVRLECSLRPGLFINVRPAATFNPLYKAALTKTLDDESFEQRYNNPAFVRDALVASMDGIYDENGEPVPYTAEIGLAILADEENVDVREWVIGQALEIGHFYVKSVEADAKN